MLLLLVNTTRHLKILIFSYLLSCFVMAEPNTNTMVAGNEELFANGLENFGIKLYANLAASNRGKNLIFSPFSIQTCAAMARLGAEGSTATELDQGLNLITDDLNAMADLYHNVLSQYEKSDILKIANKIYVQKDHEIQDEYNKLLNEKFFSKAEEINFSANVEAARAINSWVALKTNNRIQDLISSSSLSSDTRLILLNAIHFKGEWVHKFPERSTRDKDFYLDENNTIKVPMMRVEQRFRYGSLTQLDATVLEMDYKDSDLSMLIILPNSRTGLKDLEEKLKTTSLKEIMSVMFATKVIVEIPKFKAEFEVELQDAFKQLGISRMFGPQAEFGKMLKSAEPLQVSKVVHKAFIEVNEKGTEAAAATGIQSRRKRDITQSTDVKEFIADHPFIYQIVHRSSKLSSLTLFMGSINKAIQAPIESEQNIRNEL
ncbi:antichymotrypsin-2-like isoform X2 [Glossina fuscipes]|uniref:Antichymotrypsin-2-like isoform X2 n=1 Tax=Glossina fuscipes TaxID=7396 RepID=A0A9C6DQ65_9MUSC|nr:antichymotrypsin-2-like isoform X2 [Glossina fuscipes]